MNFEPRTDYESAVILMSSAFGLAVAILVLIAIRRRLISFGAVAIMMAGFALIHFVGPLFRRYGKAEYEAAASLASLATIVGIAVGMALVVVGRPSILRGPDLAVARASVALTPVVARRLFVTFLGLGLLGVVGGLVALEGSLTDAIGASRFELRGTGNPIVIVVTIQLARCLLLASFLIPFTWRERRRHQIIAGAAIAVALALTTFLLSRGARALPVGILGAFFVGYAVSRLQARTTIVRWTPTKVFRAAVVLALVGWLVVGAYDARRFLSSDGVVASLGNIWQSPTEVLDFDREPLDYHNFTVRAAEIETPPSGQFLAPIRRLIFAPLPSGGLKPPDTNNVFANEIFGNTTATIPPSIPGEGLFVVGGAGGALVWGTVYGVAIAVLIGISQRRVSLAIAMMAVTFEFGMLLVRGQFYDLSISVIASTMFVALGLRLARSVGRAPPIERGAPVVATDTSPASSLSGSL